MPWSTGLPTTPLPCQLGEEMLPTRPRHWEAAFRRLYQEGTTTMLLVLHPELRSSFRSLEGS